MLDPECWLSGLVEGRGDILVSFKLNCSIIEDPQCIKAKHTNFNWLFEQINAFEKLCELMVERLKQL